MATLEWGDSEHECWAKARFLELHTQVYGKDPELQEAGCIALLDLLKHTLTGTHQNHPYAADRFLIWVHQAAKPAAGFLPVALVDIAAGPHAGGAYAAWQLICFMLCHQGAAESSFASTLVDSTPLGEAVQAAMHALGSDNGSSGGDGGSSAYGRSSSNIGGNRGSSNSGSKKRRCNGPNACTGAVSGDCSGVAHLDEAEQRELRYLLFELVAAVSLRGEGIVRWVNSLYPRAAAVVGDASADSRMLASALQLLYGICFTNAEDGPVGTTRLHPVLVSVLSRSLHSDGTSSAAVRTAAAALLALGWKRKLSRSLHSCIAGADMSWLVAIAESAPRGSQAELWALRAFLQAPDHPRLAGASGILRRLPAAIARCTDPSYERISFWLMVPLAAALRDQRPMLQFLLTTGLLPAIARCLVALADITPKAAVTALQQLTAKSYLGAQDVMAAVPKCNALHVAAVHVCGFTSVSAFVAQLHMPKHRKCPEKLLRGIRKAVQKDAARTEAVEKLRGLHECAFDGCGRVEDVPMQFKACGACVQRASSSSSSSDSSNDSGSECDGSSSGSDDGSGGSSRSSSSGVAWYCSRECQVADRYAGHAHCVLAGMPDTGEDLSAQQQMQLMKLLLDPANAAKHDSVRRISKALQDGVHCTIQRGKFKLCKHLAEFISSLWQRRDLAVVKGEVGDEDNAPEAMLVALGAVHMLLHDAIRTVQEGEELVPVSSLQRATLVDGQPQQQQQQQQGHAGEEEDDVEDAGEDGSDGSSCYHSDESREIMTNAPDLDTVKGYARQLCEQPGWVHAALAEAQHSPLWRNEILSELCGIIGCMAGHYLLAWLPGACVPLVLRPLAAELRSALTPAALELLADHAAMAAQEEQEDWLHPHALPLAVLALADLGAPALQQLAESEGAMAAMLAALRALDGSRTLDMDEHANAEAAVVLLLQMARAEGVLPLLAAWHERVAPLLANALLYCLKWDIPFRWYLHVVELLQHMARAFGPVHDPKVGSQLMAAEQILQRFPPLPAQPVVAEVPASSSNSEEQPAASAGSAVRAEQLPEPATCATASAVKADDSAEAEGKALTAAVTEGMQTRQAGSSVRAEQLPEPGTCATASAAARASNSEAPGGALTAAGAAGTRSCAGVPLEPAPGVSGTGASMVSAPAPTAAQRPATLVPAVSEPQATAVACEASAEQPSAAHCTVEDASSSPDCVSRSSREAGDSSKSGKATPTAQLRRAKHATCAACGAAGRMLRCARCLHAHFCNTECQRRAWPKHKLECSPVLQGT